MISHRHLLVALLVVTLPPGDAQAPMARLSGRVVSADGSQAPLRRAMVTIDSPGLPPQSVVTGDDGIFVFEGLPAGRYDIEASKPAYLTTAYGATAPGRPGSAVRLAEGRAIDDLTIPLARGAVIAGTVRDANSEPLAGIEVRVANADGPTPDPAGTVASVARTDDRGQYRVFGLAGGSYVVSAIPRTQRREGFDAPTVDATTEILDRLRRVRAGEMVPPLPIPQVPLPVPPGLRLPTHAFSPIYYPGTPMPHEAVPVAVVPGDERLGTDFVVTPLPVFRISGSVTSWDGEPVTNVAVRLQPTTRYGGPATMRSAIRLPSQGSSSGFVFLDATMGRYLLMAFVVPAPRRVEPPPGGSAGGRSETRFEPETMRWARTEITVSAADVSGVHLVLRPALSLDGQIALDGSSAPPDLARLRIRLRPVDREGGLFEAPTSQASPLSDGSFTHFNIVPGRYSPTTNLPDNGPWWARSFMVGGRDILDAPLTLDETAPHDAVLTLTDARTAVTGRLEDVTGRPASDYYVLLFPAEPELWRPMSRRIRAIRPATDGRYEFDRLPSGQYLIAALTDLVDGEWADPAFLEQARAGSVAITVVDRETTTQDLRIAR